MLKKMFVFSVHLAQAAFMCFMTSSAKPVALGSVWDLPVMYRTHSQSPAYPSEIVEYPPYSSLSMGSPFFKREIAPLKAIKDNYPKTILTLDELPMEFEGIRQVNILDFLLQA